MSLRRLVLSVLVSVLGVLAFASAPAFAGPPAAPTIEEAFTTEVASTSAVLHAQVNPQGAETSYVFEYAPSGGAFAPVPEPEGAGTVAEGVVGVPVSVHVQHGLAPNTSYQFRLVAHNSVETVSGKPVSFTTQHTGGALTLPDGRLWEMVSPPQKHGALILAPGETNGNDVQAAADGSALTYGTSAPTEANPQGYALKEQVLSTRGPAGWESQDISAPNSEQIGLRTESEYLFFSSDLSHGILQPLGGFEQALSPEASEQTAYLRTDYLNGNVNDRCAASCYRPLVTGKPGYANVPPGIAFGRYETEAEQFCDPYQGCGPQFVSATSDLSHAILQSEVPLFSEPPAGVGINSFLSEWSDGKLTPVGVLPDGELAGDASLGFYSSLNNRRAISDNGSRVVWYQREYTEPGLYLRDTAKGETLKIASTEGSSSFQIASSDGSRVFFTTAQKLTPDSGAKENGLEPEPDLYECEVAEEAGKLECRISDLTPPGSSGESADVNGLVLGASEDGSYVYFAAGGALTSGAVPGHCLRSNGADTCNIYVSHNGATKLVAVVSSQDRPDWDGSTAIPLTDMTTRVSPDGRWLTFMSDRDLTGYDTTDAVSGQPDEEVYLYDAASGHLVCASCNPTGARPVGSVKTGVGGEGELVDEGGIWHERWLAANIPAWTPLGQGHFVFTGHAVYQPRFLSDSGRLFFNSHDALVPQDVNGTWDVYQYEPEGVPSGEHACASSTQSGSDVFKPAHSFAVEGRQGEEGAGCVGLISSGASAEESAFIDASATGGKDAEGHEGGGDVFFLTAAKLAPQDTDTSTDVYDAHECTGASPCVPPPAAQPPPCDTEASCKAAPTPQPSVYGLPSSATFAGPGNAAPPPPVVTKKTVKCSKAKKLSHGKCVKVKAKHKKKAHKASHNPRASR